MILFLMNFIYIQRIFLYNSHFVHVIQLLLNGHLTRAFHLHFTILLPLAALDVVVMWEAFVDFVYFNSCKIKACAFVFSRFSYFNFAIFMSATHNPSRLLHIYLVPHALFLCWFVRRELRTTKIWSTNELSSSTHKKPRIIRRIARCTYILCDVEKVLCCS